MPPHRLLPLLVAVSVGLAACSQQPDVVPQAKPPAPAGGPVAAATPADGIVFAHAALPAFVARVEGISQAEAFGRWTDGPVATIELRDPLPRKFDLVVQGSAFGPNVGQPVKVTVGGATQDLTFSSDTSQPPETRRLAFSLDQPASRIEFAIPHPTQPENGDVRALGLALVSLKIEAPAN